MTRFTLSTVAVALLVAMNTVVDALSLFGARTDYAVGNSPQSVFIADLDGDGDNDLAVANFNSASVSVFLNNGDGTFASKVDYGVEMGPQSVFIADLDGDGDNDLAVANAGFSGDGTVSVLLNNGDGTFASNVRYSTGFWSAAVFIADLDGDGDNDLAVANYSDLFDDPFDNNVSVLLNNGDGTFRHGVDHGVGSQPRSVFGADLDGDGDNDLAVANWGSNTVSVLLNKGDGTFELKVDYNAGDLPRSVFIADLDGDGDNDLAIGDVAFGGGTVSVLLNNGDGTFAPKASYIVETLPQSVFSTDLDGDGYNDLVAANEKSNAVSVLLNNGDGTFAPKVAFGVGSRPQSVFSADLDGDGDNDLVTANWGSNSVSVLLNLSSSSADDSTAITVEAESALNVPESYGLSQNYPNPFNAETVIHYDLPNRSHVNISVFNMKGQKVATLVDKEMDAGRHSIVWYGRDKQGKEVGTAIYIYRMKSKELSIARKAVILK